MARGQAQSLRMFKRGASEWPIWLIAGLGLTVSQIGYTNEPNRAPLATNAPVVSGFERFYRATVAEQPDNARSAGLLLLGELNCTACHQADEASAALLLSNAAPNLEHLAERLRLSYLPAYLANPHLVKPGTTMPDVLHGVESAVVQEQVLALQHYLVSLGASQPAEQSPSSMGKQAGEKLFHQIGCVACHAPKIGVRDDGNLDPAKMPPELATSKPWPNLADKYTVPSLVAYLKNPQHNRAQSRMPMFRLKEEEYRHLAEYLLKDLEVPNTLNFAYYEGYWDQLPDLSQLEPKRTGQAVGLDLAIGDRRDNFAMRFTGYLHLPRTGRYQFFLGSDDGSRLTIGNREIVLVDGHHPHQVKSGAADLEAGVHPIAVDYMQGGGEWTLELKIEGPEMRRQSIDALLTPTPEPLPQAPAFEYRPELAELGKQWFQLKGCVNCHQVHETTPEGKKQFTALLKAPPLAELTGDRLEHGCLAETVTLPSPQFHLDTVQRQALQTALRWLTAADQADARQRWANDPKVQVDQTLTAFNCYACHARENRGGVEELRNGYFLTTQREMGDEARIPPHLTGIGAKIKPDYLQNLFANGGGVRDKYMLVQMPRFGLEALGPLPALLAQADPPPAVPTVTIDMPEHRLKAIGRHLVGDKAFSCIKCHTFGEYPATGVQAMSLNGMTQRLQHDWFVSYLRDPQAYRPGTRMPASWPKDQPSMLYDVLDGDSDQQIEAVWLYLTDGAKATLPSGLIRNPIELKPTDQAIIYRNFITGVSPRGIAVGFPEGAHYAFDANTLALRLIWHGSFIDASRHWNDRGVGFQSPAGDHQMTLAGGIPFAPLADPNTAWPTLRDSAVEVGGQFLGYRTTADSRPTFRYRLGECLVEEFINVYPIENQQYPGLVRQFTLTRSSPIANLYYRAASGKSIEAQPDGSYLLDGAITIKLSPTPNAPVLRQSGGQTELLLAIPDNATTFHFQQWYRW